MKIIDIEQGTPEWFALRIGNPGASSFNKIVTSTGKSSTQRQAYLYQLAGEIITGQKADTYQNHHMTRGIELETEARETFCFITDQDVSQCGLVYPDHTDDYHCSPDGLLKDSGLEIKCPSLSVATEYLHKNTLPTEYVIQVQGSMMVTGLTHWYFMSYFPKIGRAHV